MRALFTSFPSHGHVHPLLPLARALRRAGHEVVVATGEGLRAVVDGAGLPFVPAGLDQAPTARGFAMFGRIAAPAMLPDLERHVAELAPDVVVHEEGEWAGPVAAAAVGVPSVAHGWGSPLPSADELAAIERASAPLWAGIPVTPASPAGLFEHLYVDVCPPPLQAPHAASIVNRRVVRFEAFDDGEPPPAWLDSLGSRPLVYVTLGTVATANGVAEVVPAVIEALVGLEIDVVVSVGPSNDARAFDPLPANVRVEPYLSQAAVLRKAAAAITHGGAGSTLAALSYGVPVLLLPRGAPSQLRLTRACVGAGLGVSLSDAEVSPERVATCVGALLTRSSYRRNAVRLHQTLATLPSVESALGDLERLADARRHQ